MKPHVLGVGADEGSALGGIELPSAGRFRKRNQRERASEDIETSLQDVGAGGEGEEERAGGRKWPAFRAPGRQRTTLLLGVALALSLAALVVLAAGARRSRAENALLAAGRGRLEELIARLAEERPCLEEAVCYNASGRLGNNLFGLGTALWLASRLRFCYVALDEVSAEVLSAIIVLPDDGIFRLHRGAPNLTRAQVWKQCLPGCAGVGSCRLGEHSFKEPAIHSLRSTMQAQFVRTGRTRCGGPAAPADTLVMHLRSGDVSFSDNGNPCRYIQPPCAFWVAAMRRGHRGGPFASAILVTESDLQHACLEPLKAAFPGRVRVQARSVAEDACTMASAVNLVLSHGTWGPALGGLLNPHLQNVHVPFGVGAESLLRTERYDWWQKYAMIEDLPQSAEGGVPFTRHLYGFPGYQCVATTAERRQQMREYEEGKVVVRTLPGAEP